MDDRTEAFIRVVCSKQHMKYRADKLTILAIPQSKVDQIGLSEIRVVRKISGLRSAQNSFLKT